MLKIALSSAVSALAVFLLMSLGASGQTPRPTATALPVESVITATAVYTDAETIIFEVRDDLKELFRLADLKESTLITGNYSLDAERMAGTHDMRSVPLDLRPLVFSKFTAARMCSGYFRSLEDAETSDNGLAYGMVVFPLLLRCNTDLADAATMLFEKAADYDIDLVID